MLCSNNEPVLKDISFQIFPNSLTIIKGNQGCGKSTLFKLIQNLYSPQHGEISFDGINYKNYTPFEIRKEVTIVSDEAPLLGATIFKAVSYNTSELKRQKAIAMLKKLEVQLPCMEEEILEFKVDDGGKNISAGQRIKLQFARAFLTRKTIILIDNVFGALDKNGQEVVISELNKLRKKHTILIVDSPFIHHLKIDHIVQL